MKQLMVIPSLAIFNYPTMKMTKPQDLRDY